MSWGSRLPVSSDHSEVVNVAGTGAGVVVVGVGTVICFYLAVASAGFDFVVRIYAFLRFVYTNHRPSPLTECHVKAQANSTLSVHLCRELSTLVGSGWATDRQRRMLRLFSMTSSPPIQRTQKR